MIAQFCKDFKEPRSARQSIFDPSKPAPIGTVVHGFLHKAIYCKER